MIRLYCERTYLSSKLNYHNQISILYLNANLAHVEFIKKYDFAFNHMKFVRLSRKRAKDKKWFNAGLKKSKQIEMRFYKQNVRSPTVSNISKYKIYWSIYAKCVQAAEQ